ncbi:hypothetical protein BC5_0021 [Bacillus phage BC-5]|uniref:Uncharacterized protein n=1 Tax=Bacillus phage BC-5 TaxID=3020389 RepID=A0AAF0BTC9_9CAUD|nr:hypothetical protein BC5_0021 [Bacillus phage BC-5]
MGEGMVREELIRFLVSGFNLLGENVSEETFKDWSYERLEKKADWLDYLLDK